MWYSDFVQIFTARKRSLGQGNVFRSMCQEFCRQWGGLPQCMLGYPPLGAGTPQSRHPPRDEAPLPLGPGAPPGPGSPPPQQSMLGDLVNERAVRILLECNLVLNCKPINLTYEQMLVLLSDGGIGCTRCNVFHMLEYYLAVLRGRDLSGSIFFIISMQFSRKNV